MSISNSEYLISLNSSKIFGKFNIFNVNCFFQRTPDGEVKVIERYDCSGAGDVDTSKVVKPTDDTIVGLSGRSLKLTASMKAQNTSGEYRVGLKSLHDLYPTRVREKILADKKTKNWDEFNKKALANVAREMTEFESKNTSESTLFELHTY